jgi:DNA modification methylase
MEWLGEGGMKVLPLLLKQNMAKSKTPTKVSELTFDDKNFNKGNPFGEGLIEKSFSKFGAGRSILLDKNNRIIAGNKSTQKFAEGGGEKIIVVETDGKTLVAVKRTDIDLDTPQGREMALADNMAASKNITIDAELVTAELTEAVAVEWGVETGTKLEAEEDDFDVPEGGIETDIVVGDLFEIGEHRLLCGDSTDSDSVAKLMDGSKADMVFTSPPYNANTSFTNVKNSGKLYENYDDNLKSKDYVDFASSVLELCFLNTDGYIFWNVNYNTNSKNEFIKQIYNRIDFLEELICWKKIALPVPAGLTRTWEPIFVFKTNKELKRIGTLNKTEFNYWDINNSGALDKSHRAAFPIKLVEKAVNLVTEAKIVLEPFCGSGTTMVASHQLKRKCYGMELDPKYCQVIVDRMIKLDPTLIIKKNGVLLETKVAA